MGSVTACTLLRGVQEIMSVLSAFLDPFLVKFGIEGLYTMQLNNYEFFEKRWNEAFRHLRV